jgi:hypothetical protein
MANEYSQVTMGGYLVEIVQYLLSFFACSFTTFSGTTDVEASIHVDPHSCNAVTARAREEDIRLADLGWLATVSVKGHGAKSSTRNFERD